MYNFNVKNVIFCSLKGADKDCVVSVYSNNSFYAVLSYACKFSHKRGVMR